MASKVVWNNLNKMESFKELKELKGTVSLQKALKGASGAKRVAECNIPMAAGLNYNYAAKQIDKKNYFCIQKACKRRPAARKVCSTL